MNGKLEYFRRPQDFCSMPKFDLKSINYAMFFNPSKDSQDELFTKFLKDQCDKDLPIMKMAKGKRVPDLVKKEPWIYYKYPPPATEKVVSVSSRVPDNSLVNFLSWYFDERTLAAVILRNKDDVNDIDMILETMDLLKFGKEDMKKLHESPIRVYCDWDEEAKPFTRKVLDALDLLRIGVRELCMWLLRALWLIKGVMVLISSFKCFFQASRFHNGSTMAKGDLPEAGIRLIRVPWLEVC
ncbi:hypothetical protein R6Q57_003528 [Mikania cordata]